MSEMQFAWLCVCCGLVVMWDLTARRVPNLLLAVLAVAQCAWIALDRSGIAWQQALLGFGLGFAGLLPFYLLRVMGAADVKFAAVLGLFCGPRVLFLAWLVAGLCAGGYAVLTFLANRHPWLIWLRARWTTSRAGRWLESVKEGRRGIPYAAYLAFGACLVVVSQAPVR